jgi:hypothetical protein
VKKKLGEDREEDDPSPGCEASLSWLDKGVLVT